MLFWLGLEELYGQKAWSCPWLCVGQLDRVSKPTAVGGPCMWACPRNVVRGSYAVVDREEKQRATVRRLDHKESKQDRAGKKCRRRACSRNHLPLQACPAPRTLRKKLKSGTICTDAQQELLEKLCAIPFFFNLWNSIFFQPCYPYLELSSRAQETGSVISVKLLSDLHSANALDLAIKCPH